jgi:hypothetical protein
MLDTVRFHIGEVIPNPKIDTYNYTNSNSFEIYVRTYTDFYNRQELRAIPLNVNNKQIPLVGEHVLIVQGLSAENNSQTKYPQWYYVSAFSLNSDVNANLLQGVSLSYTSYVPNSSFTEQSVSPMQPYEGDVIHEGRFSNSIRLGSTVLGGNYSLQPSWNGTRSGDPIIIISNGKSYQKDSYAVENINDDNSSIYLTSTQILPNFKLNNRIRQSVSNSDFSNSQFIATADRVILKSKSDVIVLDSKQAIELNSPVTSIGVKQSKEPVLHSTAVETIFNLILQIMNGGLIDSNGAPVVADPTLIANISTQLAQLKNKSILQDTYKG